MIESVWADKELSEDSSQHPKHNLHNKQGVLQLILKRQDWLTTDTETDSILNYARQWKDCFVSRIYNLQKAKRDENVFELAISQLLQ